MAAKAVSYLAAVQASPPGDLGGREPSSGRAATGARGGPPSAGQETPAVAPPVKGATTDGPAAAEPEPAAEGATSLGATVDAGDAPPRWWLPGLAALAVLAGVVAVACSALVFPYLSSNSDEGSYLTQGESLAAGHLLTPAPQPAPAAFRPWLSVLRGDSFVSKFTPVHASALALSDAAFGSPVPALAAIAAAGVVLLALLVVTLGGSHRAGLGAGALLVASPAWLVQSGTYLPYLSSLALLLAAALGVAKGAVAGSTGRRVGWFALGGAAWGAAFFGRQFDAVLLLVPLAVIVVRSHHVRRAADRRSLLLAAGAFAVGVLPFIVLLGAYNHVATGSVTKLPFNLLERSDTVGFGKHRVQSKDGFLDYTPKAAVHATLLTGIDLLRGVAGSAVLVAVAAYGLLRDRRLPGRLAYLAVGAAWLGGYFFFWGTYAVTVLSDVNSYLGPIYYLPAMVAGVAAAAVTLDRLVGRARRRAGALVALIAVVSVVLAIPLLKDNLDRTEQRRAVADTVNHTVPKGKTLLLTSPVQGPFVGHPLAWLRDGPGYDDQRLMAVHDPVTDFALLDEHADRSAFMVSLIKIDPVPAVRAVVEPVSRFRSTSVVLQVNGPPPEPGWQRTISLSRGRRPEWSAPTTASAIRLQVTAGPAGVTVVVPGGPPLAPQAGPVPSVAVAVRFRDTDSHGRVRVSERRVPVRGGYGLTEVLLPGQLFTDGLRSHLTVTASAAPPG